MMLTILRLLCLIPTALRLRSELALENLALRQQLAVLNRQQRRPKLRRSDRLFWLLLSRFWADWKEALVIVKPETVLRWHRKRFASYWSRLSRNLPGRPGTDREIRELIRRMAKSNMLWGAPRVHGQLLKLGIVREIRMLRAMRRELETEPRRLLNGHAGGNPGHSQGGSYGPPRQFPTLPGRLLLVRAQAGRGTVECHLLLWSVHGHAL